MKARAVAGVLLSALALTACSSEPATCEEVANERVEQMQRIIDDFDEKFGDMPVDDFLESGATPQSPESFSEESQKLNDRATELGCVPTDLDALIAARIDTLTAETPVGEFIKDAIQAGE